MSCADISYEGLKVSNEGQLIRGPNHQFQSEKGHQVERKKSSSQELSGRFAAALTVVA